MLKHLLLFCLGLLLLTACEGSLFTDRNVEYSVTLNGGSAEIKYEDKDGKTVTEQFSDIGWRQNFEAKKDAFLYVKAIGQTTGQIIKVSIKNNGKVLESSTADGDFVTVVASTNIN